MASTRANRSVSVEFEPMSPDEMQRIFDPIERLCKVPITLIVTGPMRAKPAMRPGKR